MVFFGICLDTESGSLQLREPEDEDLLASLSQAALASQRNWSGNDKYYPCLYRRYIGIDLHHSHATWTECEASGNWGNLTERLMREELVHQARALVDLNQAAEDQPVNMARNEEHWLEMIGECLRKKFDRMHRAVPDTLSALRAKLDVEAENGCLLWNIIWEETVAEYFDDWTWLEALENDNMIPPEDQQQFVLDQPNTLEFALRLASIPYLERSAFLKSFDIIPGIGFVQSGVDTAPTTAIAPSAVSDDPAVASGAVEEAENEETQRIPQLVPLVRDWSGDDVLPPSLYTRYNGLHVVQSQAKWNDCMVSAHWEDVTPRLMREVLVHQARALNSLNTMAALENLPRSRRHWHDLMQKGLRIKIQQMYEALPDTLPALKSQLDIANGAKCLIWDIVWEETMNEFSDSWTCEEDLDDEDFPREDEQEFVLDQPNTLEFSIQLMDRPHSQRAAYFERFKIVPGIGFTELEDDARSPSATVPETVLNRPSSEVSAALEGDNAHRTPEDSPAGTPIAQTPADQPQTGGHSGTVRIVTEASPAEVGRQEDRSGAGDDIGKGAQ